MPAPTFATLAEKIDPNHTAMLVIDMQNDFVSPGGAWERTGEDLTLPQLALKNIIDLISSARQYRVPIVFIRSVYNTENNSYLSPVFLYQAKRFKKGRYFDFPVCVPNSWGWELAPGLELRPEDTVVTKHRFSAFINTDLDLVLRSKGIQTLIFTGVGTAVCVESTARHAFFVDYYNVFAADCCGAYNREVHEQALKRLDTQYGEVTQSKELVSAWRAGGR